MQSNIQITRKSVQKQTKSTSKIITQSQCVEMEITTKKPSRSLIRTSISAAPRVNITSVAKQQPSMGVDMLIKKIKTVKTVPRAHDWEKTYINQAEALMKKDLTPFLDSINFDSLVSADSSKPVVDIHKTPVTTRAKAKFFAFRSIQTSHV